MNTQSQRPGGPPDRLMLDCPVCADAAGAVTGAPVPADDAGVLECHTRAVRDGGDHCIPVSGAPSVATSVGPVDPLVHHGARTANWQGDARDRLG